MQGVIMGFFDNKTVTLFSRSFNAETEEETYYPTLLECVDLVETKGANISKSGIDSADTVKLYVDFKNIVKPYLPPKEWENMPDKCKQYFLTFNPAQDFFIKGDQTAVDLPETDAYEWMRNNFDDVYKVTNIDKYEDILPHFEVGGV
jgi:hypothetical protein|nr:MAG TPA: hypothetical protein [Bacteriophage sp.]DAG68367.1 MAG TPA: hypothetical protein [Caudoviricetes sp.]DAU88664.1 MAG TPA: hypothetical protein [Caudoviricetes sp.]DAV59291.1 MAG TPA: hypothetical protein [Caudoviricetes sp.]DAV78830.1 MAG TPA: hypothetical protein [Caudoviricetes sp.]